MSPRKRRPSELLEPGEYDELYAAQDGRCAICRAEPGTRRLDIDHNHRPPRLVRGLLCSRCNRALPGEELLPGTMSLGVWLAAALRYVAAFEVV